MTLKVLHFKILLVASVLVFGVAVRAQQPAAGPAPVHIKTAKELGGAIAQVDQLFAAEYAKSGQASVTAGIVSGDKLVWTKSYGLADIEKQIPATRDSTYRIGSITKQFTAIMLLQLVQQGKVHLSDPVKKYFPEIEQVANPYPFAPPITLLQLATHMSGLDREPDDRKKYTTGQVADWEKILLSAMPHLKFAYEPGTQFFYSNMGYAILGETLSRAAGEPFIEYVQRHILQPLGMTHTAYEQNDEILRTIAKGYVLKKDVAPDPSSSEDDLRNGRGGKIPAGALFTTIDDLAHFVSFEMGDGPETVLPKAVQLRHLTGCYSATRNMNSGYGIGLMYMRDGDTVILGHGGNLEGYVASAFFDPAKHVGIVWMRNSQAFGAQITMSALKILSQ